MYTQQPRLSSACQGGGKCENDPRKPLFMSNPGLVAGKARAATYCSIVGYGPQQDVEEPDYTRISSRVNEVLSRKSKAIAPPLITAGDRRAIQLASCPSVQRKHRPNKDLGDFHEVGSRRTISKKLLGGDPIRIYARKKGRSLNRGGLEKRVDATTVSPPRRSSRCGRG
jgi:hypothetical protein